MTDPHLIAGKLTKAQREAIFPGPGNPEYAAGHPGSLTVLKKLGLVPYTYRHANGRTHGGRLTALGRAVRDVIEGEGK